MRIHEIRYLYGCISFFPIQSNSNVSLCAFSFCLITLQCQCKHLFHIEVLILFLEKNPKFCLLIRGMVTNGRREVVQVKKHEKKECRRSCFLAEDFIRTEQRQH